MADEPQPFFHKKNITFGRGRIIYAPPDMNHEASWILPGGARTTNHQRAFAVAVEIDRITTELEKSHPKVSADQWPGVTLDRTMRA